MIKPFTYAEIDLQALTHNIAIARQFAGQRKLMAVVKANAYGHGFTPICTRLEAHCDGFAVARLQEALELRALLPDKKILWLSGPSNNTDLELAVSANIETVIHDISQVLLLKTASTIKKAPCHLWLKVDSGMHRLGFLPETITQVLDEVSTLFPKTAITLMSHFSSAENLEKNTTARQLKVLKAYLPNKNDYPLSFCNSAALMYHPNINDHWVRPGLMLYGAAPCPELRNTLQPVMSFHSTILAEKKIKTGESVGYGCRWTATENTSIAIIAAGYADGYPIHAPDGTPVMINGHRYPIIGRVSMDMLCVNCSGLPKVHAGQKVELWGKSLPAHEIANFCNMIPYALFTGVTERVERFYNE